MSDNYNSNLAEEIAVERPVKQKLNPIVIIGALFFVFGFITWLNSVLIPYLKIACELNNFRVLPRCFLILHFLSGHVRAFRLDIKEIRLQKWDGLRLGGDCSRCTGFYSGSLDA